MAQTRSILLALAFTGLLGSCSAEQADHVAASNVSEPLDANDLSANMDMVENAGEAIENAADAVWQTPPDKDVVIVNEGKPKESK
jgi:hypothetical protein